MEKKDIKREEMEEGGRPGGFFVILVFKLQ